MLNVKDVAAVVLVIAVVGKYRLFFLSTSVQDMNLARSVDDRMTLYLQNLINGVKPVVISFSVSRFVLTQSHSSAGTRSLTYFPSFVFF